MSDMKITLVLDAEQLKKGVVEVKGKLNEVPESKKTKMTADTVQIKSSIAEVQRGIAAMAAGVFAAGKIWGALVSTMNQSIDNARAQTVANRILESQLIATNNAVGISSERLKEMASELQRVSNLGDEAITQNLTVPLTTFKAVSGPIFERAAKNILDLNAVIGDPGNPGSLKAVTMQLGKALQDPITGLTALRRAGVSFTEAQRETIKAMVETSRLSEAQTLILSELETQFGGAAAAAINSSTQMKNAWGDMLEEMGMATLPALDGINTAFANFFLLMSEQYGNAFANQHEAMMESFKFTNDIATGLSLNLVSFADFVIGIVAYTNSAISGLAKTARTATAEISKQIWQLSGSLPSAVADAITGFGDWSQVKDVITGVGKGVDAVSAQVQNTNNEMQMNMNFMLNGFKEYEKNFSNITQKSMDAYRNQLEQRKAYQQQLEDMSGGGGQSDTILDAAGEAAQKASQRLIEELAKWQEEAGVRAALGRQKELLALELKYKKEQALLSGNHAQLAVLEQRYNEDRDAVNKKYNELYNAESLKAYEQYGADIEALRLKHLQDTAAYYEQVKFADASYYGWRRQQIVDEVNAMQIADQQKKDLIRQLVADLETQQAEALAKKQSDGSFIFKILGFDPDNATDIAKYDKIKAASQELYRSTTQGASDLMRLSNMRRDQELANLQAMNEAGKMSDEETIARRKQITQRYAQEAKTIGNIQKGISIAQTTINTAEAAVAAYKAMVGIPIVGPILAPIASAAAIAAGAVQIAAIKAQKFAEGGLFRGVGGSKDDKNIIAVSDGEYIVNAAATQRNKALLDAINYGSAPITQSRIGFANGGMVSAADGLLGAFDRLEKRLEMINLNIASLELQNTIHVSAPDVKAIVERNEIVRQQQARLGREYSFGI